MITKTKQEIIIEKFVHYAKKTNSPILEEFESLSIKKIAGLLFNHTTSRNGRGMRLSSLGVSVLTRFFESYLINLTIKEITSTHLIFLDRHLNFPYFLEPKHIRLFDSNDALELKLLDGDLDAWVNNKKINSCY